MPGNPIWDVDNGGKWHINLPDYMGKPGQVLGVNAEGTETIWGDGMSVITPTEEDVGKVIMVDPDLNLIFDNELPKILPGMKNWRLAVKDDESGPEWVEDEKIPVYHHVLKVQNKAPDGKVLSFGYISIYTKYRFLYKDDVSKLVEWVAEEMPDGLEIPMTVVDVDASDYNKSKLHVEKITYTATGGTLVTNDPARLGTPDFAAMEELLDPSMFLHRVTLASMEPAPADPLFHMTFNVLDYEGDPIDSLEDLKSRLRYMGFVSRTSTLSAVGGVSMGYDEETETWTDQYEATGIYEPTVGTMATSLFMAMTKPMDTESKGAIDWFNFDGRYINFNDIMTELQGIGSISGGAYLSSEIPDYSIINAKNKLIVNVDGTHLEWLNEPIIPNFRKDDAGKVLTVNKSGNNLYWSLPDGIFHDVEFPETYEHNKLFVLDIDQETPEYKPKGLYLYDAEYTPTTNRVSGMVKLNDDIKDIVEAMPSGTWPVTFKTKFVPPYSEWTQPIVDCTAISVTRLDDMPGLVWLEYTDNMGNKFEVWNNNDGWYDGGEWPFYHYIDFGAMQTVNPVLAGFVNNIVESRVQGDFILLADHSDGLIHDVEFPADYENKKLFVLEQDMDEEHPKGLYIYHSPGIVPPGVVRGEYTFDPVISDKIAKAFPWPEIPADSPTIYRYMDYDVEFTSRGENFVGIRFEGNYLHNWLKEDPVDWEKSWVRIFYKRPNGNYIEVYWSRWIGSGQGQSRVEYGNWDYNLCHTPGVARGYATVNFGLDQVVPGELSDFMNNTTSKNDGWWELLADTRSRSSGGLNHGLAFPIDYEPNELFVLDETLSEEYPKGLYRYKSSSDAGTNPGGKFTIKDNIDNELREIAGRADDISLNFTITADIDGTGERTHMYKGISFVKNSNTEIPAGEYIFKDNIDAALRLLPSGIDYEVDGMSFYEPNTGVYTGDIYGFNVLKESAQSVNDMKLYWLVNEAGLGILAYSQSGGWRNTTTDVNRIMLNAPVTDLMAASFLEAISKEMPVSPDTNIAMYLKGYNSADDMLVYWTGSIDDAHPFTGLAPIGKYWDIEDQELSADAIQILNLIGFYENPYDEGYVKGRMTFTDQSTFQEAVKKLGNNDQVRQYYPVKVMAPDLKGSEENKIFDGFVVEPLGYMGDWTWRRLGTRIGLYKGSEELYFYGYCSEDIPEKGIEAHSPTWYVEECKNLDFGGRQYVGNQLSKFIYDEATTYDTMIYTWDLIADHTEGAGIIDVTALPDDATMDDIYRLVNDTATYRSGIYAKKDEDTWAKLDDSGIRHGDTFPLDIKNNELFVLEEDIDEFYPKGLYIYEGNDIIEAGKTITFKDDITNLIKSIPLTMPESNPYYTKMMCAIKGWYNTSTGSYARSTDSLIIVKTPSGPYRLDFGDIGQTLYSETSGWNNTSTRNSKQIYVMNDITDPQIVSFINNARSDGQFGFRLLADHTTQSDIIYIDKEDFDALTDDEKNNGKLYHIRGVEVEEETPCIIEVEELPSLDDGLENTWYHLVDSHNYLDGMFYKGIDRVPDIGGIFVPADDDLNLVKGNYVGQRLAYGYGIDRETLPVAPFNAQKEWDGIKWVDVPYDRLPYTPNHSEIWRVTDKYVGGGTDRFVMWSPTSESVQNKWYYCEGQMPYFDILNWKRVDNLESSDSSEVEVDDVTIDKDTEGRLEIKLHGVTLDHMAFQQTANAGKVVTVGEDGYLTLLPTTKIIEVEELPLYGTDVDIYAVYRLTTDNEFNKKGLYTINAEHDNWYRLDNTIEIVSELPDDTDNINDKEVFMLEQDMADGTTKGFYIYREAEDKYELIADHSEGIKHGEDFPDDMEDKELFVLEKNTVDADDNPLASKGLYIYREATDEFELLADSVHGIKHGTAFPADLEEDELFVLEEDIDDYTPKGLYKHIDNQTFTPGVVKAGDYKFKDSILRYLNKVPTGTYNLKCKFPALDPDYVCNGFIVDEDERGFRRLSIAGQAGTLIPDDTPLYVFDDGVYGWIAPEVQILDILEDASLSDEGADFFHHCQEVDFGNKLIADLTEGKKLTAFDIPVGLGEDWYTIGYHLMELWDEVDELYKSKVEKREDLEWPLVYGRYYYEDPSGEKVLRESVFEIDDDELPDVNPNYKNNIPSSYAVAKALKDVSGGMVDIWYLPEPGDPNLDPKAVYHLRRPYGDYTEGIYVYGWTDMAKYNTSGSPPSRTDQFNEGQVWVISPNGLSLENKIAYVLTNGAWVKNPDWEPSDGTMFELLNGSVKKYGKWDSTQGKIVIGDKPEQWLRLDNDASIKFKDIALADFNALTTEEKDNGTMYVVKGCKMRVESNDIEYFPGSDVFTTDTTTGLQMSALSAAYKVIVIGGKIAIFNAYFGSSVKQTSAGWKNMLRPNTSWKYKIGGENLTNNCLHRMGGSMYTNQYVNMAFENTSGSVIRAYYYSGIVNQTGGVNVNFVFPVELKNPTTITDPNSGFMYRNGVYYGFPQYGVKE